MKRTRTLVSYFSRVPEQQGAAEQQPQSQAPPPQSQGTEQETIGTRASAAQAQNQPEEVRTATTSLPAVEQTRNENIDFVEEEKEGGSNHVLNPQDIIVDPGCRKPIEEMHPNIRDDAKRRVCLVTSMSTKRSCISQKENIRSQ